MPYLLSPIGNESQIDGNGDPLIGGKIYTYLSGSSTPAPTYTSIDGSITQANPIVLNSLGLPASPIWLYDSLVYRFMIFDANNVLVRGPIDNITGIANPTPPSVDQWIVFGGSPTFLSTTSFSLSGDQRSIFQQSRRVRTINTGGTVYSTIVTSTFSAGATTITLLNDSGVLDVGISQVAYGILSSQNDSIPAIVAKSDYLTFTGVAELTTTGTSPNYVISTALPLTSYVAGQRLRIKFHAAGLANPLTNYTLNVNSLGAKSLLASGPGGFYIPPILANTVYDIEYDGTEFIVLNALDGANRVGEYIFWPLNSTPIYALLCNGAAVSRSTYARLFKILGTAYGAGDGTTTFNLPNITAGYTLANSNGSNAGTATVGDNIAHTHIQTTFQIGGGLGNGGSAPGSGAGPNVPVSSQGSAANFPAAMYARVCIIF